MAKRQKQWKKWDKQKTKPSREVGVIDPNRPIRIVQIGNVRARVWLNDSPIGPELKVDCGYVYSTGGNNPYGRAGFTNSIPLNAAKDAIQAMKVARRWAYWNQGRRNLLNFFFLRW